MPRHALVALVGSAALAASALGAADLPDAASGATSQPVPHRASEPPRLLVTPEGAAVALEFERSTPSRWGRHWRGTATGGVEGAVEVVVRDDGVLRGYLRSRGGETWRLRQDVAGPLTIELFAAGDLPPCAGSVPTRGAVQGAVGGPGGGGGCDGADRIDLLVLYTPLARDAAGGTAAIEAEIVLSVQNANFAYGNSGITTSLNIVGVSLADYDESGEYVDHLYRLTDGADGYLDEAHVQRDQLGADLVALVVDDGDYCGIAWIAGYDAAYGFSVTTWYCAAGNYTMAHEIGHNQGCCHAAGDGGGCTSGGLFSYSVGHRFFGLGGTQWRTVMAYSPGARIPHFSNPDVLFDGVPTGVPVGTAGEAHNALTINQTAESIANFRCSVVPGLDVVAGPVVNPSNGRRYWMTTPATWNDSRTFANLALGSELTTIVDGVENEWVRRTFASEHLGGFRKSIWIGLNDQASEGTFVWADGSALDYACWGPGEPNQAGEEDWVQMLPWGSWNDQYESPYSAVSERGASSCPAAGSCFAAHAAPGCDLEPCCNSVCMLDVFCCEQAWDADCAAEAAAWCAPGIVGGPIVNPANGHRYYLLEPALWHEAERVARSLGGHLATIDDAAENAWVLQSVKMPFGNPNAWLGLSDEAQEGIYTWVSTSPAAFTNWSPGEPNDGGGSSQDVTQMYANGTWDDVWQDWTLHAIVEVPCLGDLDGDGAVGGADLGLLLGAWGHCGGCAADLNLDGDIDGADLGTLLGGWGGCL